MDRLQFIRHLAVLPLITQAMDLKALAPLTAALRPSPRMPVLFLGHGSPMNAIEENEFVNGFRQVARTIPKPQAILCVSAHWETRGTKITAMDHPRTIHDFGGFPQALFDVQYPAPGSPSLVQEAKQLVKSTVLSDDHQWGLDHGAWSVIKHLYPAADVPVVEMSLDVGLTPDRHYALAKELSALRDKGVLIIGSGNMVHNLRMVAWDKLNTDAYGYDWALEARRRMNDMILRGDHQALIDFRKQGREFDLAIPSTEHYLPLLYTLGLQGKGEQVKLFNDKPVGGSLTMTSLLIDKV